MSGGKIFLESDGKEALSPMVEKPYEAEDILQALIEKYPDLIPGDQITPEDPRKWFLVIREMGVPSTEGGGGTWSLDHLFLDQEGIPTFIECKRSSDTRIRREVVAQMLDYAANGTYYWTMDRLRQSAENSLKERGKDLTDELMRFLETDSEEELEDYWKKVEENLREGKVRLAFVADILPRELRRLIEFLNEKMSDVEVIGVEIRQFVGDDKQAYVPRVIGLTEAARTRKDGYRGRTSDETFLETVPQPTREFFQHILDRAHSDGYDFFYGEKEITIGLRFKPEGQRNPIMYLRPRGGFSVIIREEYRLPEEDVSELKQALRKSKLFRETPRGSFVVELEVCESNEPLKYIDQVFDLVQENKDNFIW
jgi:hypothetical protein